MVDPIQINVPGVRKQSTFFSYPREHEALAGMIIEELQARGVNVMWDREIAGLGAVWRDRIEEAILESDYVIALISRYTKHSENQMNELKQSIGKLLPVLFGSIENAPELINPYTHTTLYEASTDYIELVVKRLVAQIQRSERTGSP